MLLRQKNLIFILISFLIFLVGFENYKGILSHYIFSYEYIANENIFSQNDY